ncbi:MAG: hypothetical protein P1T08_17115 [Acidimicrobiia bacterium]|nr:hypothetical protein [Acidimicrobiia bacterium]
MATEQRYLLDPIHPQLFALEPGDADSFIAFVEHLGMMELLRWIADTELFNSEAWRPVIGAYEVLGIRRIWEKYLIDAWTDAETVRICREDRRRLMRLFEDTARFDYAPPPQPSSSNSVNMIHCRLNSDCTKRPVGSSRDQSTFSVERGSNCSKD